MEDSMILVFRTACSLIFIAVTTSTLISVYYSRKNGKEPGAVGFSENFKEALFVSGVAFKVLVVMVPFLCIGCLLLFFFTYFRIEAIILLVACIQIPVIFFCLSKNSSWSERW